VSGPPHSLIPANRSREAYKYPASASQAGQSKSSSAEQPQSSSLNFVVAQAGPENGSATFLQTFPPIRGNRKLKTDKE
jgi:hypothetical protein